MLNDVQAESKIKINNDIYLSSDRNNWIVTIFKEGVNPKTKEPTRTSRDKYFATLLSALNYLLSEEPKKAKTISDVILAINKAKSEILQAIKGL